MSINENKCEIISVVMRNDGAAMSLPVRVMAPIEETEFMRSFWGFWEPGGSLYLYYRIIPVFF